MATISAQSAPTIQLCDERDPEFCLTSDSLAVCFAIIQDENYNEPVDFYQIEWTDDESEDLIIPAAEGLPATLTYVFDVSDHFASCLFESDRTIRLTTRLVDGSRPNSSTTIFLRNAPKPAISFSSMFACVGQEICVADASCPSETLLYTRWDFGAGQDTSSNACYTYDLPGRYTIKLFTENACDTATTTRTIEVVDAPEVEAVPDSNIFETPENTFYTCLDGQTCVRLNGELSRGINRSRWELAQGPAVTITEPTDLTTRICFTTAGPRILRLIGYNDNCGLQDEHLCEIDVVAPIELELNDQEDACLSLSYTPEPGIDPDATYLLDGDTVTAFPLELSARTAPYVITATKTSLCDTLVATDVVSVDNPVVPTLLSPSQGAAFCPDTLLELIEVSDYGGTWADDPALTVIGDTAYLDRSAGEGDYTFVYTLGEGLCTRTLTVHLSIVESEIDLPEDFTICSDADPVALTVSPGGGVLSGPGVNSSTATFDPGGLEAGRYDLAYTYENNATGCTEVGSWEARVIPPPTAEAGPPNSVCNSDQLLMPADYAPGLSFPADSVELTFFGLGVVDPSTGSYRASSVPAGVVDTIVIQFRDSRVDEPCVTVDTLLLTVTDIVTPSAGPDSIICGGSATFFLGDGQGGTWSGPGAAPDGTVNLAGLTPATYTYMLTLGQGVCESSDEKDITIVAGNGVSVARSTEFLCDTAAVVTLPEAQPLVGGQWSGQLPINGQSIDVSQALPGSYTFSYRVTGLPGACNSADFTVQLLAQPELSVAGDSVACDGAGCVTFNAVGTGDAYVWRTSYGADFNAPSICVPFPGADDYTVMATAQRFHPVTGSVLCQSLPDVATVRILDSPAPATPALGQDTICPGEALDLQFTPSATAGREHLRYDWTFGATTFSVAGDTTLTIPSPVEDTTYTFTLTTIGGCGDSLRMADLVVRANPVAAIDKVDLPNCSGGDVILTNRSTGTVDRTTWTSSDGQTFNTFQPPILNPVTDSTARNIRYTVVVENTCAADTASLEVTVEPTQLRALASLRDDRVCVGEALNIRSISTPGTSIDYLFSDGRRFFGDSISPRFDTAGPITFIIYARNCGYDSSIVTATVLPAPDIEMTIDPVVCAGVATTFSIDAGLARTVVYLPNGDSTTQTVDSFVFPAGDSSARLSFRATSLEGCTAEGATEIAIEGKPMASISETQDTICSGEAVLLRSSGSGGQTCSWLSGDGQRSDGCTTAFSYASRGTYRPSLIYTSPAGCQDTASTLVFVRPTPEVALAANYDALSCGRTPVEFTYAGDLDVITSFSLLPGDGSAALTGLNPQHIYDTSGVVTATLRAGFDGVCFGDTSVTFTLRQTPRAQLNLQDERCQIGDAAIATVLSGNPEDIISASGPDGFSRPGINQFDLTQPGDYVIEIIGPGGCDTLIELSLDPVRPLTLSTIDDANINLGDSVRLLTVSNSNNVEFRWAPNEFLTDFTAQSPWARPELSRTYLVTATDTLTNCSLEESVRVSVDASAKIYVPTAFSPNNDGINDHFEIFPTSSVAVVRRLRVFDRWGSLVFDQTKDFGPLAPTGSNWDGRWPEGKLAPAGTYVWQLEFETFGGERRVSSGEVVLMR